MTSSTQPAASDREEDPDPVAAVRAFSRFYTAQLRILDEGLLKSPYSLTECRVLFELAQLGKADSTELRRALDLDAGYLSRLLGRFEADGLITRRTAAHDARRNTIVLTESGRAAFAELNQRSDDQVRELLKPLSTEEKRQLVSAMAQVKQLLGERQRPDAYLLRPLRPGDYGWVISRHGVLYAEELGWGSGFEAYCAHVVADYAEKHDAQLENAWIAEAGGEPVGCIFCVRRDAATAQLRLLLVEPSARGLGVGSRLVEECVRFARAAGYRRMVLFTTAEQEEACRLYARAGFELEERTVGNTLGVEVEEQLWSVDL
jgi:DNA-binding MarR family transcriptional regulator/N-acetylglutamate synthase-like GNAT family acetyltransferase